MARVRFHESMHNAIWAWIRSYCDTYVPAGRPHGARTPGDILECICSKLPSEIYHITEDNEWVVEGGEQEGDCDILGSFSEKMCSVGEYLYTIGKQEKLHWHEMKRILQHYINDITRYMANVNSLRYNYLQLNEYFDLNLSNACLRSFSPERIAEHVLWSRYLTGVCVFIPNISPEGPAFREYMFARGDDVYWGPKILHGVFRIGEDPDIYVRERISASRIVEDDEVVGENIKKKEALKKIQSIVDEVQQDLGDGAYLKLMNVMKEEWSS